MGDISSDKSYYGVCQYRGVVNSIVVVVCAMDCRQTYRKSVVGLCVFVNIYMGVYTS